MANARREIARIHDSAAVAANPRTINDTLIAFRKSSTVAGRRELKYICLGLTTIIHGRWMIAENPELVAVILRQVEAESDRVRRIRLFQALLSAYWKFPKYAPDLSIAALEGWNTLRQWLKRQRDRFESDQKAHPDWFHGLLRHRELLTTSPCRTIGTALLKYDDAPLIDAVDTLAIPKDSWLHEEAILGTIEAACKERREEFRAQIPRLLALSSGKQAVPQITIRCVATIVSRYARDSDHSENQLLRDAAVTEVGNPWLKKTNWDTHVLDSNKQPDSAARQMVSGWLKRRLISDFFELLSLDGTGDQRRLNYWLRLEPQIEDMWFALGPKTWYRRDTIFAEFKTRASGRLLDLVDTTANNNAFIMRINGFYAVEFGEIGNACFVFSPKELPQELNTILRGNLSAQQVSRDLLTKTKDDWGRLLHIDKKVQRWEEKFDTELAALVGTKTAQPPNTAPAAPNRPSTQKIKDPATVNHVHLFADEWHAQVTDNRLKGGALWVQPRRADKDLPEHARRWLKQQGFRLDRYGRWYKSNR
ncbi:MAG: hypothetical protein INH43_06950 [Acidobacteriaceae bacterium]|nr:hypothetical protein [Acidobacteriaceae bacterium]